MQESSQIALVRGVAHPKVLGKPTGTESATVAVLPQNFHIPVENRVGRGMGSRLGSGNGNVDHLLCAQPDNYLFDGCNLGAPHVHGRVGHLEHLAGQSLILIGNHGNLINRKIKIRKHALKF